MPFFRRRSKRRTVTIHLNARLLPLDRGELFEDPLDAHLSERSFRTVLGDAGTLLSPEGEPTSCDVELEVDRDDDLQALAGAIAEFLDSRGAPRGSTVVDEGGTVLTTFGVTEGLALYLNGTDLAAEVYAASDTNEIVDAVNAALDDSGRMLSYWHGPEATALYLYGPSEEVMRARLANLLATRPDMQLSRLESIT
jgi:hypothetical protein